MQVQAGRYSVELKELTWWDAQEVQAILMGGAKMGGSTLSGFDGMALMQANAKAIEKSVVSIKEGEASIAFSMDWLKQLTQAEGDAIKDAIDELAKKK